MKTSTLVLRSMKKNISMYYLYFFAMIFSISLYFIFATLQNDRTVMNMVQASTNFATSFQVAGFLLISITIVFTIYATNIFIRRRSQEIGLYQLIGLSKGWVARVLILEHTLLGIGALLVGLLVGALLSRLFLVLFVTMIGLEVTFGLTFSVQALVQSLAVFTCLLAVTVVQITWTVYRSTLLQLFKANQHGDAIVKRPTIVSALLGATGLALIVLGYFLSTFMVENADDLLLFMLAVIASTIGGTYLVFRTSIGWLLSMFRQKKNGDLGLYNSLSVAPLMHRMKGNANSLTLITVLSAMTITMISLSFSLYYNTEEDTRIAMPYDFAVENMGEEAATIAEQLNDVQIGFESGQIEAVRFLGAWEEGASTVFLLLPAEQVVEAGLNVAIPNEGEAIYFNSRAVIEQTDVSLPIGVQVGDGGAEAFTVTDFKLENAMNYRFYGNQMVVNEETFEQVRGSLQEEAAVESEELVYDTFQVTDEERSDVASAIFLSNVEDDAFLTDFYSDYESARQTFGLLIFIAGILGFVFILSTGSILYFKQMTEAEQERSYYVTMRQLGFQVSDMMKGIRRKQYVVFLLPLGIGILHAAFALKVGSVLMAASMLTPILISMAVYILIYLIFMMITIQYYKKIVQDAL
ncbi:ABC transporter permease [Paenalkalicoccus suaedae]|uniref:ABC transporter permease n=1 Tax=Paenalkalicoccus suaedae TaxID=2592382 RepID=A0A859FJA9_9BACI|nr:FtsX-like permease family protein [Paenalkalicoccus suaedae]QKS72685.1 ABC transporter permease [Paenalkalicoccus suaedae]